MTSIFIAQSFNYIFSPSNQKLFVLKFAMSDIIYIFWNFVYNKTRVSIDMFVIIIGKNTMKNFPFTDNYDLPPPGPPSP